MSTVNQAFKHNRQRKNVVLGGAIILICITLMSCVSSFMIYREGFTDLPQVMEVTLSLFAVVVVEGAFVWLVYGFTRAFSSSLERLISLAGVFFLVGVMLMNIVTHFMMVKGSQLHPFQDMWLAWGAVSVFIAVLLIVLAITLADPVIRLVRLELKYLGRQQEIILEAKTEGLESDTLYTAMASRAEWEAGQLAAKVMPAELPAAAPARGVTGFSPEGGKRGSLGRGGTIIRGQVTEVDSPK